MGDALTRHPLVRKVGFTGSTEVGKQLMQWYAMPPVPLALRRHSALLCALSVLSPLSLRLWKRYSECAVAVALACSCACSNAKVCSLELGGKSPLIIFNDCEFEKAVRLVRHPTFTFARLCKHLYLQLSF